MGSLDRNGGTTNSIMAIKVTKIRCIFKWFVVCSVFVATCQSVQGLPTDSEKASGLESKATKALLGDKRGMEVPYPLPDGVNDVPNENENSVLDEEIPLGKWVESDKPGKWIWTRRAIN